ncbi:hypothetical protein [Nocardioides sp. SYSU D00038]|uniref:hypothetical protein n=1 Tax=Nocardioides sp. SYSU D00038 TaxID=2812554 RepID=UPI0019680770|nr:hypothetical protein [Nocardioides sp. SYSU D00038]
MSPDSPATAAPWATRLAWWGTAWLRGWAAPDDLLDAVIGEEATHTVAGLAALGLGGDDAAVTLMAGLARLRVEGATSFGAAYPVEGDLVGLGGPPAFNSEAVDAGQAVVASGAGVGLVPVRVGAVVTWHALPAAPRQLPDLGEADRGLRAALLAAADELASLDVARWRPEVADQLMNLRHRRSFLAPDGVPQRSVDLLSRAVQALQVVDLALEDDGGAVSLHEIQARRAALEPLARAGRHAMVAASSPEAWPPD